MDIKGIEAKIADQVTLAIKAADTLKLADSLDLKATANIGGKHLTVNVTNIVLPQLPSLWHGDELQELPSTATESPSAKVETPLSPVSIVLSRVMGIVVANDLSGTRVHLEFVVVNREDRPHGISWAGLTISGARLNPKQFFSVTREDLRVPDATRRWPLVLAGNAAIRLALEFENVHRALISVAAHEADLVLESDAAIAIHPFTFRIMDDTAATLTQLKKVVDRQGGAVVVDLPIDVSGSADPTTS